MREENEGFSKLMTELNQDHDRLGSQPATVLRHIQSLIGYFELDPNRVLDMVLDAFETSCSPRFFVELLKLYPTGPAAIATLLQFKFEASSKTTGQEPPESLFRLAATLIQGGLLVLNDVYNFLR